HRSKREVLAQMYIESTTESHCKWMLGSAGACGDRSAPVIDGFGQIPISIRIRTTEQQFTERVPTGEGDPDHRPEQISKHVGLSAECAGRDGAVWCDQTTGGRYAPIGAAVTHQFGFDSQIARDVELGSSSASIVTSVVERWERRVEAQVRVLSENLEP